MFAESKPGTYALTEEEVGTRFAVVSFRHSSMSRTRTTSSTRRTGRHPGQWRWQGPYEAPDWDLDTLGWPARR